MSLCKSVITANWHPKTLIIQQLHICLTLCTWAVSLTPKT